jgi:inward rectifier potassium channel
VALAKDEVTAEGERYRNFYDLTLERQVSPVFALSWTVVHPINASSPLHGITREELEKGQAEIFVSLTGIDDTFSQTIHTRYSYTPQEILWDKYFEDILSRNDDREVVMNLTRMHAVRDEA